MLEPQGAVHLSSFIVLSAARERHSAYPPVKSPLPLSWPWCCFPVGVGPLRAPARFLGDPGTRFAADPESASPAGEKIFPRHSSLLWESAGSRGPAEPQTQSQYGFSYLLQKTKQVFWKILWFWSVHVFFVSSLHLILQELQRSASFQRVPNFLPQQGGLLLQLHTYPHPQRVMSAGLRLG